MRVIYKYEIKTGTTLEIEHMGGNSKPLKVKNINDRIYIWFEHDNRVNNGKFIQRFRTFTTGGIINDDYSIYVDTFFINGLVFHVYTN